MAKTIDTKKAAPKDVPGVPGDVLDEEAPLDAAGEAGDDQGDEEEEDLSLDVDPTARQDEPGGASRALAAADAREVTTRPGAGGIYVPEFMMATPITHWLADAYIELRKVTWPEPRDAWNMSLVVIAVSVIMAGLLAAADFGLGHLLSYFVSLGLGK